MKERPESRLRKIIWRLARVLDSLAAVIILLLVVGAVTGPPQGIVEWLEAPELAPQETPHTIVVLGGGGIPSGSTLLRTYCAAQYGKNLTGTTFVVSLPADGDPDTSSVGRMRDELVMRGISPEMIRMETHGLNTREQAVNIQRMLGPEAFNQPILIITSGYHMRRALTCFQKLGFNQVSGLLASEIGAEAEIGPWGWLRYGLWSNLEREIGILRELAALETYRLEGWI
jgi:uncharacterized SAM-binding protein YcdF (DUF218 family)